MSDTIDVNGIQVKSRAEIINELLNGADGFVGLLGIYGADANVDPNSPDGQLINLIAQAATDIRELIVSEYNSFDPDTAIGRNLDRCCAINAVPRKPGSRTTVTIGISASSTVNLDGFDTNQDNPFTVSDNAGNQFQLLAAVTFTGFHTYNFQCSKIGAVVVSPNSVTNIVTVTAGLVTVSNYSDTGITGTNEESDAAFRIRRGKSTALPSKGFWQGLRGSLLALASVTSAKVIENTTSAVDANGIPGHSIWAIVAGGSNADVGNVIYVKRNAGCGMKGGVTVNITQEDGSIFAVNFDRPTPQNLWIKLSAAAITGPAVDAAFLRTQILANFAYEIGQAADASAIVAFAKTIYPDASISGEGVSTDDVTYSPLLSPTTVNNQWAISAARIYVNGSHG